MAEDPGSLGQKPFKVDPLMGGVLIDQDQLVSLLHQNVGAEDLADITEIRRLVHAYQRQGGGNAFPLRGRCRAWRGG